MHFNTLFVVGAFVAGSASVAALPNPEPFGTTNIVGTNTGVGPIDIVNVGGGDSKGPNVVGNDLNSYVSKKVRRTKSSSQPEYIASPQLSNEGSCNGKSRPVLASGVLY
jgi:hypothetical protein